MTYVATYTHNYRDEDGHIIPIRDTYLQIRLRNFMT